LIRHLEFLVGDCREKKTFLFLATPSLMLVGDMFSYVADVAKRLSPTYEN
jgi:hypothetical protein